MSASPSRSATSGEPAPWAGALSIASLGSRLNRYGQSVSAAPENDSAYIASAVAAMISSVPFSSTSASASGV
jgi:hypothetical protein